METLKRGVDAIIKFNGEVPEQFRDQVTPFIEGLLKGVQKAKTDNGQKEMADYIETKLSKKGF
jgi:aminopeptidase N